MNATPLSDTVQVVNALCNLVVAVVIPVLTYLTLKQNRQVKETTVKVEQVGNRAAEAVTKVAAKVEGAAAQVREVRKVLESNAETAAAEREEVKKTLADNGDVSNKKLDDIHTLVNSNMSIQLRISALALRRVADLTKDPRDADAADEAEKGFHEHEAKQRIVDQGKKIAPETG